MSTSSLASCLSDGALSNGASSNPSTYIKETIPSDKCPRCMVQYDFLRRTNSSKVPLILNCKHTVCEDCIRRLCMANATFCPVCREKFSVLRGQLDTLPELFQPHFALIGQLVWCKNSPNRKPINLVSTGVTLGNRPLVGDLQEMNFETDVRSDAGSVNGDVEKQSVTLIFEKCAEHSDQYTNIFCEDCNSRNCCYCFLENHGGHTASYLYKLADAEAEQLEKLKTDVEVVLAQLLASKRKVKELKTFDLSHVDQDIKGYFSDLHAQLHLAERNLRKKLSNMESEEVDLEEVNATLKSGIYRVMQLMNHFNMLNTKQLNVRALYEEALEIRDFPCRLVSDQGALRPIEFLSGDIFSNIEDNIFLRTQPAIDYSLLPIDDWSHAQEMYELGQMKRKSEPRSPIELKPEVLLPILKPKKTEPETKKPHEVGKIRVIVTHLNNLNSFYVQKYTVLDSLKDMNINIGKRSRRRSGNEEFKIGGVYGVLFETKNANHWRRGKLLDIIDRGPNDRQYRMFFIDYGNTQLVTKDKLKELDIRTYRRPPFTFECKLTNPDKIYFDPNAHLLLPQIIGEKDLYIHFVRSKQADRFGVQEVDLLVATSSGGFISVRDLISKNSMPVTETNESLLVTGLKLFKNSIKVSIGQEIKVIVTHIRDPSYICVQLVDNLKILEKMKSDMEKFYRDAPLMSCIPVVGTDVIVRYEDERQGNWHRAKLTSVNIANKQAEVYFVDWGSSAQVSWSSVKLLTENFIKAECQGIIVKLAHVQNRNPNEPWTEEAIDFLRSEVASDEQCRMVVSNVEPLEVALFQPRPAADICLNSLLVEKGYAISTGSISQTVFWPNLLDGEVEEDEDLSFQMIKKSEEVIMEDDDDVHLKSGLRLQVSVMKVINPDLIFLKFAKHKELEDELHKELQIHYSETRKNKNSWKLEEYCVVYDSVRHNYFRGVIKSAPKSDNYLVYLYDEARELKVAKKMIFVYDPYFKRFICHVCKCRLSNIRPAGDAGKWSNLAVEMLQKIFATHKSIYLKKLAANEDDKILGVIMWYCLTTPAKALEPSRLKFISINQALIESGVAFSVSTKTNALSPTARFDEDRDVADESGEEVHEIGDGDIARTRITNCDHKEKKDKPVNWYELICEDEQLETTSVKTWPKPFKLQKAEFDAILTCVDSEGQFSVRDVEMESVYQDMETSLTAKLNSMETVQDGVKWLVNDMCTILYDGRWYRGTVLELIGDDEVSVEMIDFGSAHVVNRDQISKYIMFPEFPPFVNKIQLYDVCSKYGAWTPDDVNDLLQIVSDNIKVVVKGDLHCEIPFAEIYLDNGISVNDLITQKCSHMMRLEKKVVLGTLDSFETPDENVYSNENNEETDCDVDDNFTYTPLPEPLNEKHKMCVVDVMQWSKAYNVILSDSEVNLDSEEFVTMHDDIQQRVRQQPVLDNIKLNTPCVCLHPQKNVWARAAVYNVDSLTFGFVLAFFVDYGTVSLVSAGNLKKMLPEWFYIPVFMRIATVNVELVKSTQAELVLTQLNKLRGKFVFTDIVSLTPLKVHLYDDRNIFYYQNFVDCGLVKAL